MGRTKVATFLQPGDASSLEQLEASRTAKTPPASRRIPRLPRHPFRENISSRGEPEQEFPGELAVSQERNQPAAAADAADLFAAGDAAPRTATEKLVARIWAETLQQRRIGVNDDFFARGGHSLSAMRVLARLYSTLGVELPVRTIFDAPTVATLAARIDLTRSQFQPGGTSQTT